MRIADTSALYALFHPRDAHHEAALRAMEDPDPVLLPTEILTELENLVRLRSGPQKATGVVDDLLAMRQVRLSPAPYWEAALSFYRRSRRLSLADAVVVAHCILHDATPVTFDEALADALPWRQSGPGETCAAPAAPHRRRR